MPSYLVPTHSPACRYTYTYNCVVFFMYSGGERGSKGLEPPNFTPKGAEPLQNNIWVMSPTVSHEFCLWFFSQVSSCFCSKKASGILTLSRMASPFSRRVLSISDDKHPCKNQALILQVIMLCAEMVVWPRKTNDSLWVMKFQQIQEGVNQRQSS